MGKGHPYKNVKIKRTYNSAYQTAMEKGYNEYLERNNARLLFLDKVLHNSGGVFELGCNDH